MEKQRIYVLDNVKGILIFCVVFAHLLLNYVNKGYGVTYSIYSFIYFFHMPLFLMISGMLTNKITKEWLIKMGMLYLLFNGLYFVNLSLLHKETLNIFYPIASMWYLLFLVLFRVIVELVCGKKKPLIIIAILSLLFFQSIDLGDWLFVKFGSMFPCYVIGYCYKDKFLNIIQNQKNKLKSLLGLCGICTVFLLAVKIIHFDIDFLNKSNDYNLFLNFEWCIIILLDIGLFATLLGIIPNKQIIFLTKIGKNSLWIYLLHRIFAYYVPVYLQEKYFIPVALIAAFVLCFVFSRDLLCKCFDKFIHWKQVCCTLIAFILIFDLLNNNTKEIKESRLAVYPEIYTEDVENCVKITYIGDMLIFAKDNGYTDYDKIFAEAKDYFGDYTFGVFEGVVSADGQPTIGNYYDISQIKLRYSEEYAKTIAENVDFVTLGMNHLCDGTPEDVEYTTQLFDEIGLEYAGVKDRVKYVEVDGIKLAVLAYTSLMNYPTDEVDFFKFNEEEMLKDIKEAKSKGVDYVVAMTHNGIEFSNEPSSSQVYWNEFLARNGVDIILGDHSHVVQPIEYIGNTLVINCPGNFVSSLTTQNQDYGSICNIYINKNTKKIDFYSVVPIHSVIEQNGQICVEVCYNHQDFSGTNLVLKDTLHKKVDYLLPEYFYSQDGYLMYQPELYNYHGFDNNVVCYIGDSITDGSINNKHGWFEALVCKKWYKLAESGATTKRLAYLASKSTAIHASDIDTYVIALGCNDIRSSIRSPQKYIEQLSRIISYCNDGADIIIIGPWFTTENDTRSAVDYVERNKIIEEYNSATQEWCDLKGYTFIDMYSELKPFFETHDYHDYLIDGVHPNSWNGVELYSHIFSDKLLHTEIVDFMLAQK